MVSELQPRMFPAQSPSPWRLRAHWVPFGALQRAQWAKTLPARREMQKAWAQVLGWEAPRRRAWLPTPVSLPGESSWTEEPGGLPSIRLQRVDLTEASEHTH